MAMLFIHSITLLNNLGRDSLWFFVLLTFVTASLLQLMSLRLTVVASIHSSMHRYASEKLKVS